ncbi:MAG TPA: amidohydrolase family protein [Xanthobacteraceae bacterium]|jgi:predicted TIM-barrel fold metal-dependent hydrolase
MPLIDIHPHVISIDTQRFPLAPIGGHQSDWSQERPVSYDEMIAAMDKAGVAKSAVVQASSAYAFDNSYVAAAVATYPKRFTGVFSVDVLAPDAVHKMKHWMAKGLTGMRLYTAGSTMEQKLWFIDPKTFPAWTFAGEAGIPVCMQMRHKAFPQLKEILERFPKVRFIIDHLGRTEMADGPPYAAAAPVFELARYPNVYLKVTHRNFEEARNGKATPETFFPKLIQAFGANRIAWGSNYPAAKQSLTELAALGRDTLAFLPQADRDWVFEKTALTLYPALKDK